MADDLYLIDSSVYIFRSYFALEPRWFSRDGSSTEAVYGFAAFLLRFLSRERPAFVAAAFDESLETGFRHRLYPDYKANRALPDEALAFQLAACRQVADALGIATCASEEFEADDLLATLAAGAGPGRRVHLLSRDKDLAQLLVADARLHDYGYGEPEDAAGFLARRGFPPQLMPDYLALVGDPIDGIPGVPGVGDKTATALLAALGPLADWLDRPDRAATVPVRGAKTLPAKLAAHGDQIRLARRLAQLVDRVPGAPAGEALRWQVPDAEAVAPLFEDLGLGGLMARVKKLARPKAEGGRQ